MNFKDYSFEREEMHARNTGQCVYHGKCFTDCRGCWLAETGKPERPNIDWARACIRVALGIGLGLLLSFDGFGCAPW